MAGTAHAHFIWINSASLCGKEVSINYFYLTYLLIYTYQVRPHLFRRHSRTSEARGLSGPSVLELAHLRFLHMLESVLKGIHRSRVDDKERQKVKVGFIYSAAYAITRPSATISVQNYARGLWTRGYVPWGFMSTPRHNRGYDMGGCPGGCVRTWLGSLGLGLIGLVLD